MITNVEKKEVQALLTAGLPKTSFDRSEPERALDRLDETDVDPDIAALLFLGRYTDKQHRGMLVKRILTATERRGWSIDTILSNFKDTFASIIPLAVSSEEEWDIFEPLFNRGFSVSGRLFSLDRPHAPYLFDLFCKHLRQNYLSNKKAVDGVMKWTKQCTAFYWVSDEFHLLISDVLAAIMECDRYNENTRSLIRLAGRIAARMFYVGDVKYLSKLCACSEHLKKTFRLHCSMASQHQGFDSASCYEFDKLMSAIDVAITSMGRLVSTAGSQLEKLSKCADLWPDFNDLVGLKVFSATSRLSDSMVAFNVEVAVWQKGGSGHSVPNPSCFRSFIETLGVRLQPLCSVEKRFCVFKSAEDLYQSDEIGYSHHEDHSIGGAYVARARFILPAKRASLSVVITQHPMVRNQLVLELPNVLIHGDEKPTVLTEACGMKFDNNSRWETLD